MLGNNDIERGRETYVRMIEDDLARLRATPDYRHPVLDYLAEVERRREYERVEAKASPRRSIRSRTTGLQSSGAGSEGRPGRG